MFDLTPVRRAGSVWLVPIVAFALFAWAVVVVAGLADEKQIIPLHLPIFPRVACTMALTKAIDVINVSKHAEPYRPRFGVWGTQLAQWESSRTQGKEIPRNQEGCPMRVGLTVIRSGGQGIAPFTKTGVESDIGHAGWRSPAVFNLHGHFAHPDAWIVPEQQSWFRMGHLHVSPFNYPLVGTKSSIVKSLEGKNDHLHAGGKSKNPHEPHDPIGRRWITAMISIPIVCLLGIWGILQIERGHRRRGWLLLGIGFLLFSAADALLFLSGFTWTWGWIW